MHTVRFSTGVVAQLHHAGWTPKRSIDCSRFRTFLASQGVALLPSAIDFLSEFGGLRIHPVKKDLPPIVTDPESAMRFNPLQILKNIYIPSVGCSLCPIAEIEDQEICVMIDEQYRIYTGYTGFSLMFVCQGTDRFIESVVSDGERFSGIGSDIPIKRTDTRQGADAKEGALDPSNHQNRFEQFENSRRTLSSGMDAPQKPWWRLW